LRSRKGEIKAELNTTGQSQLVDGIKAINTAEGLKCSATSDRRRKLTMGFQKAS
jgi:hypothetical protein